MKYKILFLLPVFYLFFFHQPMAQTTKESRTLGAFNAVKISNGIEAELVQGDKHAVEIAATGIELDRIQTKISNRTLLVEIDGTNFGPSSVKVKIYCSRIDEITASSGANIFVEDTLDSKVVKVSASTGGYIEVDVNAQSLILHAATNAKIFIKGTTRNLDIQAYTNAEINGENLEAEDAIVKVNTAANVRFRVNESLEGSAATAGKVFYEGDPGNINVKTSFGGEINRSMEENE